MTDEPKTRILWDDESLIEAIYGDSVGVFAPFPPRSYNCPTCPPARHESIITRSIWRFKLLLLWFGWYPKQKWLTALLYLPGFVYGLIAELVISFFSDERVNMKNTVALLILLLLVAAPSYMLINNPALLNEATQLLFSILLFAGSLWFGNQVSLSRAKRAATEKWLPAAETACKDLLTIASTAERMRRTQGGICANIDPLIPEEDKDKLKGLKQLIDNQCHETASNLSTLRSYIDTAVSNWKVFIAANCEGTDCELIEERIEEHRGSLQTRLDQETPASPCSGKKGKES